MKAIASIPSIALLKPGKFTDVHGTTVTFTKGDLEDVAASYDAVSDPAPIVVGHPTMTAPAYGWIGRVGMVGDMLFAYPSEVSPDFTRLVNDGHFRKVSPQLYPPSSPANPKPGRWYLQHVGFLGAAAPAIKGLGTVSLAAPAGGVVAVDTNDVNHFGRILPMGEEGQVRAHFQAQVPYRAKAIHEARPGANFMEALDKARLEARHAERAELADRGDNEVDAIRARVMADATRAMNDDPRLTQRDAMNDALRAATIARLKNRSQP